DGSKWSIGTPPGAGDGAAFSLHATYLVSLAQPVQNASLNIVAGVVTFDLGGFAYTSAVTPLTVAPAPGPSSQLTLLNGTLNSPGLEIASTAGSSGRVVISGSDA